MAVGKLVHKSRSDGLSGDGKEELEFRREFVLGVEAVGEVYSSDAAGSVDLHPQRLNVVRAVRSPREIRQVELDLVPALVQAHRHCADERLHSRCALRRSVLRALLGS